LVPSRHPQSLDALDRLERLKLIKYQNDRYIRTQNKVCTPSDIPNEAIKKYHRQNINRALEALDNINFDERDITSIIMPIEKAKLAEAKKMIRNFRREMSLFLEAKEGGGDQVYSLNIQLFPQNSGEEDLA
jgi:uncharacterized protein (TIGR02147 family)